MRKIISTLFLSACIITATAQVKTPMPSPHASISQTVGLTNIEIKYSRPSARNRQIFDNLVPFGKVWRTGANENTTIQFDASISFDGQKIKEGEYSIHTIPGKKSWTIMLNATDDAWGNAKYDKAKEVLRIKAPTEKTSHFVESFTIDFENLSTIGSTMLVLKWENTKVSIPIKTYVKERVLANIKETMSNNPTVKDYANAARYYYSIDKDNDQALKWINKAIDGGVDAYYILESKAYIQAKLGKYTEAIKTAEKAKKSAKTSGNQYTVDKLAKSIAEWNKKS